MSLEPADARATLDSGTALVRNGIAEALLALADESASGSVQVRVERTQCARVVSSRVLVLALRARLTRGTVHARDTRCVPDAALAVLDCGTACL